MEINVSQDIEQQTLTWQDWDNIYDLVGAAMEVYNTIGRGLLEPVYQKAYEAELDLQGIPYEAQKMIHVYYKERKLDLLYKADICSNGIIVELKALSELIPACRAQLFNYMRLTKSKLGLLINFGGTSLRCERYLYIAEDDNFILLKKENYQNYISDPIIKSKKRTLT